MVSCNLTKFVPQDRYLLDNVHISVTPDSTGRRLRAKEKLKMSEIASDMNSYVRQKPNTRFLGFWRLQLNIYNTAPEDTTTRGRKWLARNAHKMGEEPVIYDPTATEMSMTHLQRAMQNKGYFMATVDTVTTVRKRRLNLSYIIHTGQPYTIKSYHSQLSQTDMKRIAEDGHTLLRAGDVFDSRRMDEERQRIATDMRNDGYYYVDKTLLRYEADSSYRAHEATLVLKEQDYLADIPDSVRQQLFTRMHIRHVSFHLDNEDFIREKVLRRHCRIKPGSVYSDEAVERSYESLNALAPVKYVDIAFEQVAPDSLDCHVTVNRGRINSVSAEVEGTYSAGDWGVAGAVGYVNKNIFRGAEELSLLGGASYEWRSNGGRGIEGKAEAGIRWPTQVELKFAYQYQQRPDEYTRTILSAGLYYTIHRYNSPWKHTFNLLDISYVRLPYVSDEYRQKIIDKSSVLRYSYQDHLIMDWSYSGFYSSKQSDAPYRSYVDIRYLVETAGNVLYGIARLAHLPQSPERTEIDGDQYMLFRVPFSQYAKGDFNLAFHHIVAPKHQIVSHIGIGVAVPYLNATAVPFEKRFFAGGANSVRGWQARTLGPGSFSGKDEKGMARYDLQAGDIHLDLNLEYRWKVWNFIELAAFTDAGNIWTIYDYQLQPFGKMTSQFFREMAWSYGAGVRLDFSVLVLRVDFGIKLYDPTRLHTDQKTWRTAPNGLGWKDDMTLHFAIGYPF